jgi:MFS transporter, putative metabolite:H+ symporter
VARDTGAPLPEPEAVSAVSARDAGFREIFRPPYGSRTLLLSVFNLLQTVGFYGFGNWVPSLLVGRGIHLTASLKYAFIIAIANPVGPLLGMLVADRMERKWQIVWSGCGIGVFMFLFARQTAPALLIGLGVLVTLSSNWMSFAFHNYQAELFPTRIRSRAVGFVYAWSRVSAAFAGPAIAFFLSEGGPPAVALFIGAAMALMVITIGGFGPRTRNLALEAISD